MAAGDPRPWQSPAREYRRISRNKNPRRISPPRARAIRGVIRQAVAGSAACISPGPVSGLFRAGSLRLSWTGCDFVVGEGGAHKRWRQCDRAAMSTAIAIASLLVLPLGFGACAAAARARER